MGKQKMKPLSIPCIGYQNINSRYRTVSDHTFESEVDRENGLCPDCLQKLKELWIAGMLQQNQQGKTFASFNQEQNKSIYEKSIKYAEMQGGSLVLWGKRFGTGKTHLAISIARHIIENYPLAAFDYPLKCPVAITTEAELLDRIRASFNNNSETEHKIIESLTGSKLLIYDDVGKVTPQNYDFLYRISFLLIDRLYCKGIRLVMTTNLGIAELAHHMGEACVSRLHEMGDIVEVKGKDYRKG